MSNMNINTKKLSLLISVIFAIVFLSTTVNIALAQATAHCYILPGNPNKVTTCIENDIYAKDPDASALYCPDCPTEAKAFCNFKPIPGQSGCQFADSKCAEWINNDLCNWTMGVHICKAVCSDINQLAFCSQVIATKVSAARMASEKIMGVAPNTIPITKTGQISTLLETFDYVPLGGCCNPRDSPDPCNYNALGNYVCAKTDRPNGQGSYLCPVKDKPSGTILYYNNRCCAKTTAPCSSNQDCCNNNFCINHICRQCVGADQSCDSNNPCCSGYYCSASIWGGGKCKAVVSRGGGCPILKTFDDNKLVTVEKLDIHSPKDQDTIATSTFTMQPVNGRYEIILDEAAYLFWDGSHINSVKLTDGTGNECKLISATHSKQGDVLSAITTSDNVRVRTLPGDRIKLTYDGCSGNQFTFSIEGYNRKLMWLGLDLTGSVPIVIAIAAVILVIAFGILQLTKKKR